MIYPKMTDVDLEIGPDTSVEIVDDKGDKEDLLDDCERSEESDSDSNYNGNNGNPFKGYP